MGLDMYLYADRVIKDASKSRMVEDIANRYDELYRDAYNEASAWDDLRGGKQEMYVSGWFHDDHQWKRDIFHELLDALCMRTCMHPQKPKYADQLPYPSDCNSIIIIKPWEYCKHWTVSVNIGYWRKASAVHGWFVERVQDGEDDCGDYCVSLEQLYELRNRVQMSLHGERELEPVDGFFFGHNNDDEWYRMYMNHTITLTNSAIDMYYRQHNELSIHYRSSW